MYFSTIASVTRLRCDRFHAAIADQPGQFGELGKIFDPPSKLPPILGQRCASQRQLVVLAVPVQGGFRIRLVVGQRLPFDAAADVVKLVDLERNRTPAGRDALRRATKRLGNLAQQTDPVGPPRRWQLTALFDRRDGVSERGFEKSIFVHWDDLTPVRLWIGMDSHVL
jgi:hypothetical protein